MVEIGHAAPEFSLYNTEKQKVTLTELKGRKLLLLFFPLAFTSVCTKELCSIRDDLSSYNNLEATVYGISVDSAYTLKKFKEEQHLNFELLSDFNKEASESYGCLYEIFNLEMRGVSKRAAFVIDRKGDLKYREILEDAKEVPDFIAINKMLSIIA